MPKSARLIAVDPIRPEAALIARAAAVIEQGGVVVIPTRGLYGLAADADNARAVERVFALKGRAADKPILVLIADLRQLERLVADVPAAAVRLMASFWPGRLTLVLPARPDLSTRLTAGSGRIGVRLPGHPVASALVAAAGRPITGTSANLSGQAGCAAVNALPRAIRGGADLILDAGPLRGGAGSTVVDVSSDPPHVLRSGAVAVEAIERVLGLSLGR